MANDSKTPEGAHVTNFIRQHIEKDLAEGKYAQRKWGGKSRPLATPRDARSIRRRSSSAARTAAFRG